jgi:PAS domain S-box-containing protein
MNAGTMEKMTILYIEDDSQQRAKFTRDLRDRGFKVHPAASGKIGLEKLHDYEIDVILCDLNMPGMTGIDVLKKVKQTGQNIPFVMLTAHGTVAQAVRSIKMGAYDFILKPADFSEIENAIHNAIEKKLLEEKVEERTKSYQDANRKLRQKAKELEKATLSLGNANVKLFEIQEELAEKNNEMKKLLEELSNKKNELQAIIDASFNCVIMVNEEGKIVSANRQINEYFGIEGDSFLNKSFEYFLRRIRPYVKDKKRFDLIAADAKNNPDSFNALIIDPHQLFEHEIKLAKPKPRIVSLLCGHVLDRNDKRMGRVWMIVDITKSKLADEQLHAIVDASPIPFIISRFADGKILYANKPLANLLGLSPSEMIGKNTPDFYENPEDRKIVLEKVKRDGHLYHHEVEIKKADGVKVWMILSLRTTELS